MVEYLATKTLDINFCCGKQHSAHLCYKNFPQEGKENLRCVHVSLGGRNASIRVGIASVRQSVRCS